MIQIFDGDKNCMTVYFGFNFSVLEEQQDYCAFWPGFVTIF